MIFSVDLRRGAEGAVAVGMETSGAPGRPIVLSSFIQPSALRLADLRASQDGVTLGVTAGRDDRGFGTWTIAGPPRRGLIRIVYVVRPGAAEEAPMSGPTGYRFGHAGGDFSLLAGRQVFVLPLPAPRRIEARIATRSGQTVVTGWPAAAEPGDWIFEGPGAAAALLDTVIACGDFETASGSGGFEVHALGTLPAPLRSAALRRALRLNEFLAGRLGDTARPYHLVFVPPLADGSRISVAPSAGASALSLGAGLPTRWLGIGRALGRARLQGRAADVAARRPAAAWILEALPVFATVAFSEIDGWRSRQDWYERFWFDAAEPAIDLTRPAEAGGDPILREWRGALVLDHALGRGGEPDWSRLARGELEVDRRDLAATPYPVPFPAAADGASPRRLADPGDPSAAASRSEPGAAGAQDTPGAHPPGGPARTLDLYLGARNLGLLEQCGCRSQQAGGLARRATVLHDRLRRRTPALAIEVGDAVPFDQHAPPLDAQKEAESDLSLALLGAAGTSAVVAGYAELAYGPEFLRERVRRLPRGITLLSANLRGASLALPAVLDRRAGGVAVRLAGLLDPAAYHLGRALEFEDATAGVTLGDPAAAARAALEGAPAGTLTIAAGPIGPSALLDIHEALPRLSLVITSDYFHLKQDPRLVFERPLTSHATAGFLGSTLVVVLQSDAYALVRLGLSVDRDGRVRGADLEEIVLDDTIADDAGVRARLDAHYAALARASGLAEAPPKGGALRRDPDAGYVGSTACAACHRGQTAQWESTPHAAAFATLLLERRQGVPGCFACHVTAYRQPGGYRTMADRRLRHVQCEACHGPGSAHAASPGPATIVRAPTAAVCFECHDATHSDMNQANFASYWSRVVHGTAAP